MVALISTEINCTSKHMTTVASTQLTIMSHSLDVSQELQSSYAQSTNNHYNGGTGGPRNARLGSASSETIEALKF